MTICDTMHYDFTLVWTYLPVLIIILRSVFFLSFLYLWLFAINMSPQGVLMLCASIIYIDSLIMHSNHFDRSCGHLCACALSVLTQHSSTLERHGSPMDEIVVVACDLLWSVCAGVEVLTQTTELSTSMSHLTKVVICCTFASTRVIFSSTSLGFLDMILRSALYYVLCSVLILCTPLVRRHDRSASLNGFQSSSVGYMCMHVLFVNLYVIIASVLFIVGLHARLIYKTFHVRCDENGRIESGCKPAINKHSASKLSDSLLMDNMSSSSTQSTHSISECQKPKLDMDLFIKLQAAKKARGIT